MAKREISARYKESYIGLAWSAAHPLLMMLVYTFVFTVVFKARWGDNVELNQEVSVIIFTGLIVFNFFSDVIVNSPSIITNNVNYVKKISFPLPSLSWIYLFTSLFQLSVSLLVLIAFRLFFYQSFSLTTLLFPLFLIPFVFLCIGFSWTLSAFGVYFRDLSQIILVLSQVLFFATPIIYPLEMIPETYRPFLYLNPMTSFVEMSREMLIYNSLPNLLAYASLSLIGLIVFLTGYSIFRKLNRGFADVI